MTGKKHSIQSCHALLVLILVCVAGATTACANNSQSYDQNLQAAPSGQHTIFLISIDGLRPDYMDRAHTPNIDRLRATGAWSMEAVPAFPTLTFSSHTSIATGTKTAAHGVPSNSFYDSRDQRIYRFPGWQRLLEAEPFWTTATRQGVRTLVLDWVLAHEQDNLPYPSAYFGQSYTRGISDTERVARILDTWEADEADTPLRFMLAYGSAPDSAGHSYGPDSSEVEIAVEEADQLIGFAHERALALWKASNPGPEDDFFFILLSDHGMTHVDYLVHLPRAAGLLDRDDITIVTSGSIGHIFFDFSEGKVTGQEIANVVAALNAFDFIDAYRREDLPEKWDYAHPYRTGDIVASLTPGHTFSTRPAEIKLATGSGVGPLGMHGYDPRVDPNMNTILVMNRAGQDLGGIDLGRVELIETHSLVAGLLGIEPSEVARPVTGRLLEWLQGQ
ncbi:MAG: alkaline phosphatase family protein [Puniceicoccaceae bacterium]|nr:MAG: alkaline phosphatase family protein [Puniceicoccaceae bacterium]